MDNFSQKHFFYTFLLFSALFGCKPIFTMSKIRATLANVVRNTVRPQHGTSMVKSGSEFKLFEKDETGYRLFSRKKWTFTVTQEINGISIPVNQGKSAEAEQHRDGDDNNVFYHRGGEARKSLSMAKEQVIDAEFVVAETAQEQKAPEKKDIVSRIKVFFSR